MVGAYIGLRGLQQGMQAVDNFSNQRARLSMIVDDGGSVEELENKIFSAAQRSKGNYNDMVNKEIFFMFCMKNRSSLCHSCFSCIPFGNC